MGGNRTSRGGALRITLALYNRGVIWGKRGAAGGGGHNAGVIWGKGGIWGGVPLYGGREEFEGGGAVIIICCQRDVAIVWYVVSVI